MNAIDILGINKNKREYLQFQNAVVIKSVKDGELRIAFKYSTLTGAKYTLTSVGLPGLDMSVPTKTIRTTRLDIPFVRGDSIEIDGDVWTVSDLEIAYENKSAQLNGNANKGWILYLNGGKGSG